MASTSWIGTKKEALRNNVDFIKSHVGTSTIISAVVKGNAYGHGVSVIVPALEDLGIYHFSVYSSKEARVALKSISKKSTLMIMGFICPDDYEWIIDNEIEFYVSEIEELIKVITTAKSIKKKAFIHLDLETGMNRTGLSLKGLKKSIEILNSNKKHLIIKGVTSHFAGAESIANFTRIKKQFNVFKRRVKVLADNGIYPEIKHIASSAASINYPETRLDLIRVGILIYGYWPSRETFIYSVSKRKNKSDPLKRALYWNSQVIITKDVPIGEFIGYGMSYQASSKMRIMVVPVGYANGYSRSMSNNGHVLVNGHRSAVIGSVNMNMVICDITEIPDVKIGDQVTLVGEQGNNEISFSSFAEMNQSLNYEILARLPENIERKLT